jgi:hypothetical protein
MPSTISIWQRHSKLDSRSISNYIAGGTVLWSVEHLERFGQL